MIPSYKIFEEYDGNYKRATVVENKIPGCIIYFDKNIILEQKTLQKLIQKNQNKIKIILIII